MSPEAGERFLIRIEGWDGLSPRKVYTRVILSGCPIDYPTLLTGLQTGHPLEMLGRLIGESLFFLVLPVRPAATGKPSKTRSDLSLRTRISCRMIAPSLPTRVVDFSGRANSMMLSQVLHNQRILNASEVSTALSARLKCQLLRSPSNTHVNCQCGEMCYPHLEKTCRKNLHLRAALRSPTATGEKTARHQLGQGAWESGTAKVGMTTCAPTWIAS